MSQEEPSEQPKDSPQKPPKPEQPINLDGAENASPLDPLPSAVAPDPLQSQPFIPPGYMLVPSGATYLPPGMPPQMMSAPFLAQQMVTAQFRSSPFPPPQEIEVLERHYPGATKRIFDLVEQRQVAEIDLAKSGQVFQRGDTRRGNWMGYSIILFVIGLSSALFYTGHDVGGSALLVADVLGIGGALYMQNPEIFRAIKQVLPDQNQQNTPPLPNPEVKP